MQRIGKPTLVAKDDAISSLPDYDRRFVICTAETDPRNLELRIRDPAELVPVEREGEETKGMEEEEKETKPPAPAIPTLDPRFVEEMQETREKLQTYLLEQVAKEDDEEEDAAMDPIDSALLLETNRGQEPIAPPTPAPTPTPTPVTQEEEEEKEETEEERKKKLIKLLLSGRATPCGPGHTVHRVGCNCPQEPKNGRYSIPFHDHVNRKKMDANYQVILRQSKAQPIRQGVFALEDMPAGYSFCTTNSEVSRYIQDAHYKTRPFFTAGDVDELFQTLEQMCMDYKEPPSDKTNLRFYSKDGEIHLQLTRDVAVGEELCIIAGIITVLIRLVDEIHTVHTFVPTAKTTQRYKTLIRFVEKRFLKRPELFLNDLSSSSDQIGDLRKEVKRMEAYLEYYEEEYRQLKEMASRRLLGGEEDYIQEEVEKKKNNNNNKKQAKKGKKRR